MIFFSFSTLNLSFHCLLSSDEKPAVNFSDNILYMITCFFLATFKILCLQLLRFLLMIHLGVYSTWSWLNFLDMQINVFNQIWEVCDLLSHYAARAWGEAPHFSLVNV